MTERKTFFHRQLINPFPFLLILVAALSGFAIVILAGILEVKLLLIFLLGVLLLVLIGMPAFQLFSRRPILFFTIILIGLALVPSSSVLIDLRVTGGGFRLFSRYFGGLFSIYDVLLGLLLLFLLLSQRIGYIFAPLARANKWLVIIILIWSLGLLIGVANASITKYGYSNLRSTVQAALPAVYLVISFLIVRPLFNNLPDLWFTSRLFILCNLAILGEGIVLLGLSLSGNYPVIKGFMGIPIVLYGTQLSLLNLGVTYVFAKLASHHKINRADWIVLIGGIFFLLLSTRRLILLTLVFNIFVVFVLVQRYKFNLNTLLRMVLVGIFLFLVIGGVVQLFVPQLAEALVMVVQSFDLTSEVGASFAGTLRLAQMQSIFLNLNERSPMSYIWGMGFGTYWYEYIPMGVVPNSTAYINSLFEIGDYGWWPYFHLPYISGIYRFGVLGLVVIFGAGIGWFLDWVKKLPSISPAFQPIVMTVTVLGVQSLLAMGDSVDSASPAVMGILIGYIDAISRHTYGKVEKTS
jgi:hypothetical protein